MENGQLITLDELCEATSLKKSWWYRHVKRTDDHAPPFIKVGRLLRFRLKDVLAWMEEETVRVRKPAGKPQKDPN